MKHGSATPLFASERSAARLLDMKASEFRSLVENGHLPRPRKIGGMDRWEVAELTQIVNGETAMAAMGMEW